MKIALVNSVRQDVRQFYPTSRMLIQAGRDGYRIGKRTSKIYHSYLWRGVYNRGKGVYKQIAQKTTVEKLPIIAGALGMLIPVCSASPICYTVAIVARAIIMKKREISAKRNIKVEDIQENLSESNV